MSVAVSHLSRRLEVLVFSDVVRRANQSELWMVSALIARRERFPYHGSHVVFQVVLATVYGSVDTRGWNLVPRFMNVSHGVLFPSNESPASDPKRGQPSASLGFVCIRLGCGLLWLPLMR